MRPTVRQAAKRAQLHPVAHGVRDSSGPVAQATSLVAVWPDTPSVPVPPRISPTALNTHPQTHNLVLCNTHTHAHTHTHILHVRAGIWHGTLVALKAQVLPASLSGDARRRHMVRVRPPGDVCRDTSRGSALRSVPCRTDPTCSLDRRWIQQSLISN